MEKVSVSMWFGYFLPAFSLFLLAFRSSVCMVPSYPFKSCEFRPKFIHQCVSLDIFDSLRYHRQYDIFFGNSILFGYYLFFNSLFINSYNYTITNTFDKLALKNVCENPKTDIKHLCKYKCYVRVSKHRKSTCSIF